MDGEQSHQGGTPRSRSLVATRKVAYVVFNGRITGVFTEWFVNFFFLLIFLFNWLGVPPNARSNASWAAPSRAILT